MRRTDRVEQTKRNQYEEWSEWRLTWTGNVDWGLLTLRYTGHLTLGTGRPGVATSAAPAAARFSDGDFVVAPRGSLILQGSRVFTHQISITIPLRTRDE